MSESNSSSKKRKLICDEEEEEAKMETFFALVRNIRDTRDRWMGLRSADDVSKSKSKRGKIITASAKEESRVWKPTFQLEDFAADARNSLGPISASSQSKNSDKEEAAVEKGIDLSLSL